MKQLIFTLCETGDGKKIAALTSQPGVESLFNGASKVAYKPRHEESSNWRSFYSIKSDEFNLLPVGDNIPQNIQLAFDNLISSLIDGIDIFFCDYNLAISADLPICNNMMDKYRSTDFVIISPLSIIGTDPRTQPYRVSYAIPRYPNTENTSTQSRIYCKEDGLALKEALNAIETMRAREERVGSLMVGINPYIAKRVIKKDSAQKAINDFLDKCR